MEIGELITRNKAIYIQRDFAFFLIQEMLQVVGLTLKKINLLQKKKIRC